jgi:oligopeptide/dipeptide ABC transporter ATP-binding protein
LLQSTLDPDPDAPRDEIVLAGEPPSAAHPPSGCRFHTRCPFVMDICRTVAPHAVETSAEHTVACHLYQPSAEVPEGHNNAALPKDYASKGRTRETSRS